MQSANENSEQVAPIDSARKLAYQLCLDVMCYSISNMNKALFVLLAFLMLLLASCSKEGEINWNDSKLDWKSYNDGLEEIRASGNKAIFIIYADWCPTCKQYSKLFKNDDVINALQGVTLIRLNMDKHPDVSRKFDVDGEYVPRTFALDKNGNIIHDLNSNNPKWWYFLPANDPKPIINFVALLKAY